MERRKFTRRMFGTLSLLLALGLLLAALAATRPLQAQTTGPGLPKLTFNSSDLFKPIGMIRTTTASGEGRGNGLATMHKGYLAVPFGRDSGASGGGFAFYNISNPRSPQLVSRFDRPELREAHGFARSNSYPGSYVVLQAGTGIEFWDWSDVRNPALLNHLNLPGVNFSDYDVGAWWLAWQAPFVYVGASGNGIYIVDASNPRSPSVVKNIPISQTGGFRIHPVFPVGNLLVATSADFSGSSTGIVTLDISDPRNPVVIKSQKTGLPVLYSAFFNGNKLIGLGNFDHNVYVWDLSNPSQFPLVGQIGGMDRPVYATVQDGFAFVGDETSFTKIDIRSTPFRIVGKGTSGLGDRSEDIIAPLGNIALVANDHGTGSAIIPHQSAPDTTGPSVTMVNPSTGASNQKLTSRVGVTLSDWFDLDSVNSSSFIVRPLGGAALPGKYAGEQGILNFWPDQPLQPGTTYEVVLPAGGIKDFSGNAIATTFTSRFTTAGTSTAPTVQVAPKPATTVGQTVSFSISSSAGSAPLSYSWDFGDGTPPTAFSSSSSASHAFSAPGHYAVKVTVRNSVGESSSSYTQTIYYPATSGKPSASSTIILDSARNRIWSVNSDTNSVTVINGADNTRLIERAVGKDPRTLAQAPDGSIWVVNLDDATVSVLDRDTGTTLRTIALPPGVQPYGLAFSPNGSAAYVTTQGTGQLFKLDPSSRSIVGSLSLGGPLRGIAISADSSRLLVTRFISPADHGEVVEVNPASFSVARTFTLALDPGPDGNVAGRGVPNYLSSITISPDGRQARVPSKKDNTSRGLFRDGLALNFESTVRTIVSKLDLTTNSEVLADRVDLNDRDMADAVVFSPLGDYIFVATQGTNTVEVFDAYNNRLMTGINTVGRAPQGLALSADGSKLYVQNFLSRNVTVYDVSGIVNSTSNTFQQLATVAAITLETLPAQVLQGKQIFYNADDRRMNRDGYIACASCHLDGDTDGRVWDFTDRGEGLRNTTMLQGRGGVNQGNVHWTANFDEIQDFEHDMRGPFGGLGFLSDTAFNTGTRNTTLGAPKAGVSPELDALAAYVTSLNAVSRSPFRSADGSLTADGQAGKLIFNQLKCYSCHAGPEFTDSRSGLLHNVGTLKASSGQRLGQALTGLDTPTLKGVWETGPYLHDGSAATLLDVLTTANASGAHGATASLSASERGQLVAYLQQLDEGEKGSAPSQLYVGTLSGAQEVPAVTTGASGRAKVVLGPDGSTALVTLELAGLTSAETMAHIHGPAGAGVNAPSLYTLPNGSFKDYALTLTAQQVQQLKDGQLYINVHTSGFPNGEIRGQLVDGSLPPPPPPTQVNLAQGKAASASSAEAANPATAGNDDTATTRWCAANGNTGQWWQVDLGASYALSGSEVMWEFEGRVYKYRIEVSANGTSWTTVVDKTGNTSSAQTQRDEFAASGRYVRLTVTGLPTSPTTWASFYEFRVFGTTGSTPTPTPTPVTPTATRTPTATAVPTPTPGPTVTPTQAPSSYVSLIARHSGKAADVNGSSTADGAAVVQWTNSGGRNQQWQFQDAGGGYFRVVNRNSGKCLDVEGRSTADGAHVVQWACGTGTNQQWSLVDVGGGYARLVARHSGKCLDVEGGSTADGALIIQWTCGTGTNQHWERRPAN